MGPRHKRVDGRQYQPLVLAWGSRRRSPERQGEQLGRSFSLYRAKIRWMHETSATGASFLSLFAIYLIYRLDFNSQTNCRNIWPEEQY